MKITRVFVVIRVSIGVSNPINENYVTTNTCPLFFSLPFYICFFH